MENIIDRNYSPETIFIRMRLGQSFTMDGPVLDKDGNISHLRIDFDANDRERFLENQKVMDRFKDQFAGFNVLLFSRKGSIDVVCYDYCTLEGPHPSLDHVFDFHLKKKSSIRPGTLGLREQISTFHELIATDEKTTTIHSFDQSGCGTVDIIQNTIKKCQLLAKLDARWAQRD